MPPFQQRVVDEKVELADKVTKLDNFLITTLYNSLPQLEKVRLFKQLQVMKEYLTILDDRIANFQPFLNKETLSA